jgi:hypothetical protein
MALLQSSDHWHGGLPVLVLDRCWLRLEAIAVEELANKLPPDTSREAPELSRYSQLIEAGRPAVLLAGIWRRGLPAGPPPLLGSQRSRQQRLDFCPLSPAPGRLPPTLSRQA